MKENTKRNWIKTIISAAAIVVICVLLICLLKFRLLARVFEDSNHHTNVPDAQEEIDRIIEGTDYSVISFMNVNYYQGVYTVTFFCEKLNINDTAECNKALSESVNAFERIVSGIGASSELYDKRICLKTRINGSLPYNITLNNYEHDYEFDYAEHSRGTFAEELAVMLRKNPEFLLPSASQEAEWDALTEQWEEADSAGEGAAS